MDIAVDTEESDRSMNCSCRDGDCQECVTRRIVKDEIRKVADVVFEEVEDELFMSNYNVRSANIQSIIEKIRKRLSS